MRNRYTGNTLFGRKDDFKEEVYVVGKKKFWIMSILTLNVYSIYFFYKHWSNIKKAYNTDVWPIARAFFSVIYIFSLMNHYEKQEDESSPHSSKNVRRKSFIFSLALVADNLISKASVKNPEFNYLDIINYIMTVVVTASLWSLQTIINSYAGDINGDTNNKITVLNVLWIVVYWVWIFLLSYFFMLS